jgi:hypothetical protein
MQDDVPADGFIKLAPNTHDISLVGNHIPDLANLTANLELQHMHYGPGGTSPDTQMCKFSSCAGRAMIWES